MRGNGRRNAGRNVRCLCCLVGVWYDSGVKVVVLVVHGLIVWGGGEGGGRVIYLYHKAGFEFLLVAGRHHCQIAHFKSNDRVGG